MEDGGSAGVGWGKGVRGSEGCVVESVSFFVCLPPFLVQV